MRPLVPPFEPPQTVPLVLRDQHGLHLAVRVALRAPEIIQHAGLVDKGQDGGDGGGLTRQEGVSAAHVDEGGGEDEQGGDDDGECGGADEGFDGLVVQGEGGRGHG